MASWIGPIMNARPVQVLLRKAVVALFQSTESWTWYRDKIGFEQPWNAVKCLRLRIWRIHVVVLTQRNLLMVLLWTNSVYAKQKKKPRQGSVRITYHNTTITKTKSWMYSLNTFSVIHPIWKMPSFLGCRATKETIWYVLLSSKFMIMVKHEPEIVEQA